MRAIGLSEVGPETIRRAHAVHPISDLQLAPASAVAGSRYDPHQMRMLDSER